MGGPWPELLRQFPWFRCWLRQAWAEVIIPQSVPTGAEAGGGRCPIAAVAPGTFGHWVTGASR